MHRPTCRRQALTIALLFAAPIGAYAQTAKAPPAAPPAKAVHAPAAAPMQLAASYDPALYSALRYRIDRPASRRPRHRGHRRRVESAALLHGLHRRRHLEDHRRRPQLGQHLRRAAPRRLDGRDRSRAVRPERHLRRHGLVEDPQQRLHRPRHVQVHRRRQDVDVHRPPRRRADLDDPRESRPTRTSCIVAALGNPFTPNADRGVFRSNDGGTTWKKVLFVSDSSGAADLELQPGNPNVVFASIWHGQRKPWTIVSGAMEGGIYKSTDGGDTWTKLGGGLPTGLFGRSNVSIPAVAAESHLRADRSEAGRRPVSLRRRGRDVGAHERRAEHLDAAVLLHDARSRPEQRRRRVRRQRGLVQEHRRRQDLPQARQRRTATITTCGSTRRTRTT